MTTPGSPDQREYGAWGLRCLMAGRGKVVLRKSRGSIGGTPSVTWNVVVAKRRSPGSAQECGKRTPAISSKAPLASNWVAKSWSVPWAQCDTTNRQCGWNAQRMPKVGRDPVYEEAVEAWASAREAAIADGRIPDTPHEREHIETARRYARAGWRNRG